MKIRNVVALLIGGMLLSMGMWWAWRWNVEQQTQFDHDVAAYNTLQRQQSDPMTRAVFETDDARCYRFTVGGRGYEDKEYAFVGAKEVTCP